jgi:nucleotide-binding universal stress UspA family protein
MLCSNVLVGYEGSEFSEKALRKAIQLAQTDPNISIHVLYVQHPNISDGLIYSSLNDSMERELAISNIIFKQDVVFEAEKKLIGLKNGYFIANEVGRQPEKNILKYAKEHQCELIVLGSRGLSGVKELFLGSVSHYVTQHSDVPVLIVK